MLSLSKLRAGKDELDEILLQGEGYGLWLTWDGRLSPVVEQTLLDYAGLKVREDNGQALWFFFSVDAFLALARLDVWSKYNPLALRVQLFPAGFKASPDSLYDLTLPPELWRQSLGPPLKFEVFCLVDKLPGDYALAGISLTPATLPEGFYPGVWSSLQADQRLPYKSTLNWYAVLKPAGNPSDKSFQLGWRDFYLKLENILRRNNLRFVVNEYFLMMPLESLRQFKQWCKDYLNLLERCKEDKKDGAYWPCLVGIVDRKKLHFNADLPQSMGLDWERLMPDFPYLSLRDGLLLGSDFKINAASFAYDQHTPETWCNICLSEGEAGKAHTLPLLSPTGLVGGDFPYCFYCGQHSHISRDCPSKQMEHVDFAVWKDLASRDMDDLKQAALDVNRMLRGKPEGLPELLKSEDAAGTLIRAVFSLGATFQLRSVPVFWKLRGKEMPGGGESQRNEDDTPLWGLLRSLGSRDPAALEKDMQNMQVRFPRDYRVYSLHGFAAMERGDAAKAEEYWRQAHILTLPGSTQAWHMMLMGRLAECQGRYLEALSRYAQVLEVIPSWAEAEYRRMVCHVKSGFAGQALPLLGPLLAKNYNFFNWMLLDHELERGVEAILYALSSCWSQVENQVQEERQTLRKLSDELANWFTPGNEFMESALQQIERILSLAEVRNFVPFQMVINGRNKVEKEFQLKIMADIKNFKTVFSGYLDRLGGIRDEAAWFPFPRLLLEFNHNYNGCAANLNWITHNNLHVAPVFKKAQELIDQEKDRINAMEKRLKLLRIVRDGTLFTLILSKKFLWMEVAGLALVLVVFPIILYYSGKAGLGWVNDLFIKQQWAIQKGAVVVISVLSAIIAGFWTVLRFDSMRDKLFEKAKRQAEARGREQLKRVERLRQDKLMRQQVAARRTRYAPPRPGGAA